jgi:DeoR/GlpR family transcriptional regulator of sugar metabolism
MNERHNRILRILGKEGRTSVSTLSRMLKVSAVTIRQDLNTLEAEGLLRRVHGGAVLREADDLSDRLGINYEQKLAIARRVASCVTEGETILIESGSVNALLARELVKEKKATIITTNVFIARQLRKEEKAGIILLGGIYQHHSESLVGRITRTCLDQLNIGKAFIGIDGYTSATGFTSRDLLRAEISAYIVRKARDVYVVSDSSKFGREELSTICYPGDIRHLATDSNLEPAYREEFRKAGIELILA